MGDPLIVNVALTGCVHPAGTPDLPITPEEVGADAKRCADEGASMFHVHARDVYGNPTWGVNLYRVYVNAVREAVPGAVVCVSLSGRHFQHFEHRADALRAGADMASVTLGSVDWPDGTAKNSRDTVRSLLRIADHWGVKPECEVFDLGHSFALQELDVSKPVYANVFLGAVLPAEITLLGLLVQMLPPGEVVWAGAGLGRHQWDVNRWSIAVGGHVRVGMEDSLWMGEGDRATNPRMVERAVAHGQLVGREPATCEETRRLLGLKGAGQ